MDRQAGGLVDHEHQAVAIEHAGQHLFRCHGERAITAAAFVHPPERRVDGQQGSRFGMTVENPTDKPTWWRRLSGGLKRTSGSITGAISDLVSKRKLDAGVIED